MYFRLFNISCFVLQFISRGGFEFTIGLKKNVKFIPRIAMNSWPEHKGGPTVKYVTQIGKIGTEFCIKGRSQQLNYYDCHFLWLQFLKDSLIKKKCRRKSKSHESVEVFLVVHIQSDLSFSICFQMNFFYTNILHKGRHFHE